MQCIKKTVLLSAFVFCLFSYGQNKYKNADKNFESLWYVKAAKQYENAIKKGDTSKEVLQKIGDAYYFNTDMENASKWYGQLFSKYENIIDSKYAFRYIHSLEGIGNYRLAKGLMKIYSDRLDQDSYNVDQLEENDSRLDYILNQQPQFYISHLSINTRLSDFGTAYFNDQIVFASTRDTTNLYTRTYKWNNQPYLNLFIADTVLDGTDLKNVNVFSKNINTKYHEAIAAFNKEQNVMYFTRNNYTDKDLKRDEEGTNHLKMYRATLEGDEWTNVTELPFNGEDFSVGQPALSPDDKQLYFVSDMPGTIGGTDIFVVDINEDGSFSNPRNLGPKINTSAREMFPFITEEKLYFASDGHLGLGGLDIFESDYNTDGFNSPINLGKPINSKLDDFAYVVTEETQRGYFSSNREGGAGDDDIYSFQRIKVICKQTIVGTVVNEQNGIPEDNAIVSLVAEDGTELTKTITNVNGEYVFDSEWDCNTKYTVKVAKEGYESNKKTFTSTTQNGAVNQVPLGIKKLHKLIVKEKGVLKIKIDIIYFDFDKSFIRHDAAIELNKIVFLMNQYPNMVIKIESHTDARGNDDYNEKLSDRRAKSTRDYIISQGIAAERLESAIGYGEKQLINHCKNDVDCTKYQHDINRRSEFIITNMD